MCLAKPKCGLPSAILTGQKMKRVDPNANPRIPDVGEVPNTRPKARMHFKEKCSFTKNFSEVMHIHRTLMNMYFPFFCSVQCCQHNQKYLIRFVLSMTHLLPTFSFSMFPLKYVFQGCKERGHNGAAEQRRASKSQRRSSSEFSWANRELGDLEPVPSSLWALLASSI